MARLGPKLLRSRFNGIHVLSSFYVIGELSLAKSVVHSNCFLSLYNHLHYNLVLHKCNNKGLPMKDWQGITELVAIAEHGSFSKAALALGVSVAQVSRHISELETKLNLKLLYRTTRSVRFTEEGNIYLQHCRHMVESLEEANRTISSFQSTPRGQLRVTAPVYYGEQKLTPLLLQFMAKYPEVELELNLTNEQLDLVQAVTIWPFVWVT